MKADAAHAPKCFRHYRSSRISYGKTGHTHPYLHYVESNTAKHSKDLNSLHIGHREQTLPALHQEPRYEWQQSLL